MDQFFRAGRILIFHFLLIITLVFLNSPCSQADIYIYVDPEGVVHFTNTPTHGKFKLILKEEIVPPEKKEEPTKEDQPRFASALAQEKFDHLIWQAAEKYGVNYALIKAIIKAESNFNPLAISKMGAKGLMQLMPGTAYSFQVKDSFHPEKNIEGGVRYLRYLIDLFPHNLYAVLAAYNAGENAVLRYRGVPPYQETRRFIQKVLQYFQQYNQKPQPNFSASLAK
ncbi:MAG: transglycosylase SLT domain-containing protein [Thermodesulfobacteriota bacterium]